jgi:hypothetical protein
VLSSSTTQPATTATNSPSSNQNDVCVNTGFVVIAIAVFFIIRLVVHKEYRANSLRKQINKLERMWLIEITK